VPADLRGFDLLHYDLARDRDFVTLLDRAIAGILGARYAEDFRKATNILTKFCAHFGAKFDSYPVERFQRRVRKGEQVGGIPEEPVEYTRFVLERILVDAYDKNMRQKIDKFIEAERAGDRSEVSSQDSP
jgi:hypothetical protein